MQGGTSTSSPTAISTSPSETKLASGSSSHPTQKKSGRGPQKVNQIGRRYQLASELITNVPWLQRASVARISWIARHCADAGWTWQEVQAAAEENSPIDPAEARRPSGLLAHRLKGVHLLYAAPAARRLMVTAWEDSRAQEHFRHAGYDQDASPVTVTDTALEAMRTIHAALQPAPATEDCTEHAEGRLDIEALTRAEVLEQRALAAADPEYVTAMLPVLGDIDTRRLLTHRIVDQALVAARPVHANAF